MRDHGGNLEYVMTQIASVRSVMRILEQQIISAKEC
jgi:DNA-binding FrmR family transcriptional regulator